MTVPSIPSSSAGGPPSRRRYAVVGLGARSELYREAILGKYAGHSELVALCDSNAGRLKLAQDHARRLAGAQVPGFGPKAFSGMIRKTRPEVVIVTSKDVTHDHYIIRAMGLGCEVITEKPMTIDERRCRAILEAQRETGRRCTVAFNYRYAPARAQVKDLLMSGVIGEVLSVDFHWLLDTHHGADYFRRWHAFEAESGGLLVHKATHHFDLVNWWLSAVPVSVMATGKRVFYLPSTARRLGLRGPHDRCHTCPEAARCPFFLDLGANPSLKAHYLDCESFDGYLRDRCVFRPDIDIDDSMSALVRYDTGARLTYSLNAFNAWEGYLVAFNGAQGRLEHKMEETVYISGDGSVPGAVKADGTYIRIYPLRAPAYEMNLWESAGGHGGGDALMLEDLFGLHPATDPYRRAADQRSGAYSILTGIAANKSIRSGRAVEIASLVSGLDRPDYSPMPAGLGPLRLPVRP
jgi:predicted dehydrogenase